MNDCKHELSSHGMCLKCGEYVGDINTGHIIPQSDSLCFSEQMTSEIQQNNKAKFKASKLLTLVVRLEKVLLDYKPMESLSDCDKLIIPSYEDFFIKCGSPKPMIIRLRPGYNSLLNNLKGSYQIIAISALDEPVVNKIIDKIDPDDMIFKRRIYRDQELDLEPKNKDFLLFPASTDMTVILDSSSRCWKTENGFNQNGFVFVSPYNYFEQTPLIWVSEFIQLQSVAKSDSVLFGIAKYLEELHKFFYEKKVESIIGSIEFAQRPILKGCYICVPDVDDTLAHNFETLTARFGGKFTPVYDPAVTHLLVNSKDDPSIALAMQYNNVYIITSGWMIDCCTQYARKDERDYPLIGVESPTTGSKQIEQPESESAELSSADFEYSNSSDMDSDDDEPFDSDE